MLELGIVCCFIPVSPGFISALLLGFILGSLYFSYVLLCFPLHTCSVFSLISLIIFSISNKPLCFPPFFGACSTPAVSFPVISSLCIYLSVVWVLGQYIMTFAAVIVCFCVSSQTVLLLSASIQIITSYLHFLSHCLLSLHLAPLTCITVVDCKCPFRRLLMPPNSFQISSIQINNCCCILCCISSHGFHLCCG